MKFVLIIAAFLVSCTDANKAALSSYGSDAYITCYSGGHIVYQGQSSGKVQSEDTGSGYNWKDKETGKFLRSNADCVLTN